MKKKTPYHLHPTISTMKYSKIVGRDKEIIQLLRLLQGQSVSVEEIRRMGKSMLVQKLAYQCNNNLLSKEFKKDNFKAHYFFFQGIPNLGKLIDYLVRELEKMKVWYKVDFTKSYNFIREILNAPTIKVDDIEFTLNLKKHEKHWKEVFYKILEDIANNLEKTNTKLILIFDELPIMLWDWHKQNKYQEAINLLDILRERRQQLEKKGLRFIFCGSIGMNVILDTFRRKYGYTGEATNEMEQFSVGSFTINEVFFLCECYTLSGFIIDAESKENLWKHIFKLSNGIPYYISKLFNIIETDFNKELNKKNINKAYNAIINNLQNHKAFKQLVDRITIYYSEPIEQANTMKSIITFLSGNKKFTSEDDIIKGIDLEKETIKTHLYTLVADHYLVREIKKGKRHYKFKYEIFRQWWKINIA